MKKKVTILTTVILCMVCLALGVSSAGLIQQVQSEIRPDFTIKIDGEQKTFKDVNGNVVYPILYNGTTYLPVRAIGEIMGKTVYWYEDNKLIELKDEATTVTDADVIIPSGSGTQQTNTGKTQNTEKSQNQERPVKPQRTLPPEENGITIDKAKEIALQKAGLSADDVIFTEASYDYEKGKWICEIEFKQGKTEYSADILASDGTIISWEIDND